ncbi:MAG TPA: sigma factor, partial [Streptomyces sp.]|nr:sigma factor [Streptomyces sp.]
MRNGDGPVRDEERGTRELPAEDDGGPSGPARLADGVDGIPEQARPHPEDESSAAAGASRWREPADGEEREAPSDGQRDPEGALRITTSSRGLTGASPAPRAQSGAGGTVTAGGTMSEHERHDEAGAQNAQTVRSTRHDPQDRSGARALFIELRALPDGSVEYAELRNRLVRMHLPLVEHLARRFRNRGEPLDDLTQVATIG